MSTFLSREVCKSGRGDFPLEGLEAFFDGWDGLWCLPCALDAQLLVVGSIVAAAVLDGPEALEADVRCESFHSLLQVGLGEGLFNAELESIPEELVYSLRGLFCSAEIVEGCLVGPVEVVESAQWEFEQDLLCGLPCGQSGVAPKAVLL